MEQFVEKIATIKNNKESIIDSGVEMMLTQQFIGEFVTSFKNKGLSNRDITDMLAEIFNKTIKNLRKKLKAKTNV